MTPPAITPIPVNMATLEQLYMEYGRLMVDKEIIDNRINAVKQMLNTRLAEREEEQRKAREESEKAANEKPA